MKRGGGKGGEMGKVRRGNKAKGRVEGEGIVGQRCQGALHTCHVGLEEMIVARGLWGLWWLSYGSAVLAIHQKFLKKNLIIRSDKDYHFFKH